MPENLIEITRHECSMELTMDQWRRLEALDKETLNDDKLFADAIAKGVLKNTIEYNGHFGSAIYFKVDAGTKLGPIHASILAVIDGEPQKDAPKKDLKVVDPIWDKLLMSGLQRQVMVLHCVGSSNAFLSGGDRMQCVWNLLEMKLKHTPDSIEKYCQEFADDNLEENMVTAQIQRTATQRC